VIFNCYFSQKKTCLWYF